MPYINVLHTSSDKNPYQDNLLSGVTKDSDSIIKSRFMSAISELERKENSFYAQFGCKSEADFFNAIDRLLKSAGKDLIILQKFNAANLNPILDRFKDPLASLNTVYIVLDTTQAKFDLKPEILKLARPNIIVDVPGRLEFSAQWDTKQMKTIVNGIQKGHFFKGGKDGSADSKALKKFIEGKGSDLIQVYLNATHVQTKETLELRNGPFNYGAEEIRNMKPEQIDRIQQNIRTFIFNELGVNSGSESLRMAANTVWNQIIGKHGVAFFAGGENQWKRNVLGAMGEFQTAVFFQYFANQSGNPLLGRKVAEVIGSDRNKAGQYLHTDVSLLDAFGIQVKNYDNDLYTDWKTGAELNRPIKVSLHPMQIPSIMSDLSLRNYVINAYFNKDVGTPSDIEWKTFFENHADEILNLAGHRSSADPNKFAQNLGDKVTFYMIRGHFIPGSVIMRGAMEQKLNVSQTTVGPKPRYGDAEYKQKDSSGEARLLKWWKYREGSSPGVWENTSENNLSTWDAKISIRTTFEYQSIIAGGKYKIF